MAPRHTPAARDHAADQEVRNQEVLRANKELAAYFKGRRTEREARAALKIIKAFVRDRERRDAKDRPALPGVSAPPAKTSARRRTTTAGSARPRRKRRQATLAPAGVSEPNPAVRTETDGQS